MGIAADIVIILVVAWCAALVASLLRQPLVLGYIAAGMLIGPFSSGLISDAHEVEQLAEIGVGLLLFALGLEFSLKKLAPVRLVALLGGPLQIALTLCYGYALGRYCGWDHGASLWFGGMASLSSTMVILKTLMAQGRLGTLSSRVMIGILIVQDLAVVPFLILLPQVTDPAAGLPFVGLALVKSILFVALMLVIGTRLLPRFLALVARWNSSELFLLTVATIGLGIGYATHLAGLSFAFGAFVAGMVLSESDFGHQALSDISPLRDLFGLLFFTSVGMLLDPAFLFAHAADVLKLVLLLCLGKGMLMTVIVRLFGYGNVIPLAVGLTMFQIGEFSFLLGQLGFAGGFLSRHEYTFILCVTIISMLLTPLLSALTAPLYGLKKRFFRSDSLASVNLPRQGLHEHMVVAGGGQVGQYVAHILTGLAVPFVIVELSHQAFEECRHKGYPVIFGDASQAAVLEAAGLSRARQLLLTIPEVVTAEAVVRHARMLHAGINVVSRAVGRQQMEELYADGVTMVILPELEAGLEMARQALLHLHIPVTAVQKFTDTARRDYYRRDGEDADTLQLLRRLKNVAELLDLSWHKVSAEGIVAGKSLRQLDIRSVTGATVVGVLRGAEFYRNPGAEFSFQAGDLVALTGGAQADDLFAPDIFA